MSNAITPEMTHTYYVIEDEYTGPGQQSYSHHDDHWVHIQTVPGRKNMSNQECEHGWLGTTQDVSANAHGAYDTIEAARAYIMATWDDLSGPHDPDDYDNGAVLERYLVLDIDEGDLATYCWSGEEYGGSIFPRRVAPGAVSLYSVDCGGSYVDEGSAHAAEIERVIRDAARADMPEDDRDEADEASLPDLWSDHEDAVIAAFEAAGWKIETYASDVWDCKIVYGAKC